VALATQKLFKDTYGLEPGYLQYLTGIIMLPWSIKIIYGILSDSVPIFGSRRRSYLYIGAVLQIFSMSMLSAHIVMSAELATVMLFLSNVAIAMSDVVLDSLMVVQSRIDPKHGSEDLQTWSWFCCSLGGIFGSITAAFITESYHPSYCFAISMFISFVIVYQTMRLNPQAENLDFRSNEDEAIAQEE
jgi:MFS family permease